MRVVRQESLRSRPRHCNSSLNPSRLTSGRPQVVRDAVDEHLVLFVLLGELQVAFRQFGRPRPDPLLQLLVEPQEGVLVLLPLLGVADDGGQKSSPPAVQFGDRDLGRELGPVLPPAEDRPPLAHHAGDDRAAGELVHLWLWWRGSARGGGPRAAGREPLGVVAKDLGGAAVEQDDLVAGSRP